MLKKTVLLLLLLGGAVGVLRVAGGDAVFSREDARTLPHPPPTLWNVLVRVERWPLWWPGMEAASAEGELGEGGVMRLSLAGDPKRTPARIVVFDPGREVAWERDGILGSTCRTRLHLTRQGEGTVVGLESRITGPQAVLARWLNAEAFARYHEAVLEGLAAHLGSPLWKVRDRALPHFGPKG